MRNLQSCYFRVGAIGAQEVPMQLARQVPVGGVAALPLEKPVVLAATLEGRHQTSSAICTTSSSLRHCSSAVRSLPWCVLEKPHCGDRQRFSSGTNFAASSIFLLIESLDSSAGDFEVIKPNTTF